MAMSWKGIGPKGSAGSNPVLTAMSWLAEWFNAGRGRGRLLQGKCPKRSAGSNPAPRHFKEGEAAPSEGRAVLKTVGHSVVWGSGPPSSARKFRTKNKGELSSYMEWRSVSKTEPR